MENLFIEASREKIRFSTTKGLLTVDDLWDLKLEDLNRLAKSLNKQVKESGEEDFIKTKSSADKKLELSFELVKYVIKVRLEEEEAKKLRKEKAQKRAQIRELIEKKAVENLEGKTIEELEKELALLD